MNYQKNNSKRVVQTYRKRVAQTKLMSKAAWLMLFIVPLTIVYAYYYKPHIMSIWIVVACAVLLALMFVCIQKMKRLINIK